MMDPKKALGQIRKDVIRIKQPGNTIISSQLGKWWTQYAIARLHRQHSVWFSETRAQQASLRLCWQMSNSISYMYYSIYLTSLESGWLTDSSFFHRKNYDSSAKDGAIPVKSEFICWEHLGQVATPWLAIAAYLPFLRDAYVFANTNVVPVRCRRPQRGEDREERIFLSSRVISRSALSSICPSIYNRRARYAKTIHSLAAIFSQIVNVTKQRETPYATGRGYLSRGTDWLVRQRRVINGMAGDVR